MSLNARGIRDLHKRTSIFKWIEKQKTDITFIQETYSTPEIITDWKFQWRRGMFFSHGIAGECLFSLMSSYSSN